MILYVQHFLYRNINSNPSTFQGIDFSFSFFETRSQCTPGWPWPNNPSAWVGTHSCGKQLKNCKRIPVTTTQAHVCKFALCHWLQPHPFLFWDNVLLHCLGWAQIGNPSVSASQAGRVIQALCPVSTQFSQLFYYEMFKHTTKFKGFHSEHSYTFCLASILLHSYASFYLQKTLILIISFTILKCITFSNSYK